MFMNVYVVSRNNATKLLCIFLYLYELHAYKLSYTFVIYMAARNTILKKYSDLSMTQLVYMIRILLDCTGNTNVGDSDFL